MTDIVFRDAAFLQRLMAILVPHGMLSFSSSDVLRYFWKRVNRTGALPASFNGDQQINLPEYRDGKRVKDGWEGNSSKSYDKLSSAKGNVLRAAQTTMNRVNGLREYRPKEAVEALVQRHRRFTPAGGNLPKGQRESDPVTRQRG